MGTYNQNELHPDIKVFSHTGDSAQQLQKINTLLHTNHAHNFNAVREQIITDIWRKANRLATQCANQMVKIEKDSFFTFLDVKTGRVPFMGICDVDLTKYYDQDDPNVQGGLQHILKKNNKRAAEAYIQNVKSAIPKQRA